MSLSIPTDHTLQELDKLRTCIVELLGESIADKVFVFWSSIVKKVKIVINRISQHVRGIVLLDVSQFRLTSTPQIQHLLLSEHV